MGILSSTAALLYTCCSCFLCRLNLLRKMLNVHTFCSIEEKVMRNYCSLNVFFPKFRSFFLPLTELPLPSLPTLTKSFDDAAEMKSVAQLLRQHKPPPLTSSKALPPLPRRSNSTGTGVCVCVCVCEYVSERVHSYLLSFPACQVTCVLPRLRPSLPRPTTCWPP